MVQHESNSSGSKIKNFRLGEVLGKGSAGTVYKSLNMESGDIVAIKQVPLRNIPKADLGRIMGEINLLNHLDHVNIVKYMDSIKTKDHLNIVLEFVENGSLANTVKKFGSLPESLIAVYIEQVLTGLCFLHSQGVIHRDIKGANILTTKEGHVKLADFGVARRLGELEGRGQDDVAGTPYWMAPEVIEMSPPSTASDIWGVGATCIELLTGSPPYFELSALPALFRIVQDPHPPIPEAISPALRDFLLQCFRKDPATRLTARKLLEHQWIRTSIARRASRQDGQDWSAVVERTLELHGAARKERKVRGRHKGSNSVKKICVQTAKQVQEKQKKPAGFVEISAKDIKTATQREKIASARNPVSKSQFTGTMTERQNKQREWQTSEDLYGITRAPSRSGSEFVMDELDRTDESSDSGFPSPISSVSRDDKRPAAEMDAATHAVAMNGFDGEEVLSAASASAEQAGAVDVSKFVDDGDDENWDDDKEAPDGFAPTILARATAAMSQLDTSTVCIVSAVVRVWLVLMCSDVERYVSRS